MPASARKKTPTKAILTALWLVIRSQSSNVLKNYQNNLETNHKAQ